MAAGRFLVTASCVAFAVPAQGQGLVNIAQADNGDELFVDRASLKSVGPLPGYRSFPATQLWATNMVRPGKRSPARTERFLFSFNCTQRTSLILVYQNNRTGIKLQDWKAADLDFKYETPRAGSLADFSMMFACSGGRLPVIPTKAEGEVEEEGDAVAP